ncbi:MAG: PEP/pyruvate-binding domain-containing protein, partial [Ignavibacteria bacterium]|nr:PEP/pyruvate-binding domain-containing protein [Ignavibacteria bacterium]
MDNNGPKEENLPQFERKFFESTEEFMIMGSGAVGGKAQGLLKVKHFLDKHFPDKTFQGIEINIPRLAVITSEHFDFFMENNNLYEIALSDESDTYIANKFQKAALPVDIVGDLRGLISKVHTPLAVRSSSILEDAMFEPFAGIYTTKMIPNNQIDEDSRFRKLTESIKLVYASTFFKNAKDYLKAVGKKPEDEKMSVIIQEVVGNRFGSRYYPEISGVARSYNYYSFGKTNPEDGIVNLAFGLGKTIVDGGISWSFSPSFPNL